MKRELTGEEIYEREKRRQYGEKWGGKGRKQPDRNDTIDLAQCKEVNDLRIKERPLHCLSKPGLSI